MVRGSHQMFIVSGDVEGFSQQRFLVSGEGEGKGIGSRGLWIV